MIAALCLAFSSKEEADDGASGERHQRLPAAFGDNSRRRMSRTPPVGRGPLRAGGSMG